jgi:glutamine cyclotransferase
MAKTFKAQQIANDYNLFCEYIDVDATTTESEFYAMTYDERVALIQSVIDCMN